MNDKLHELNANVLLRPEKNAVTAVKYFELLDAQFQRLDAEIDQSSTKSLVLDAQKLIRDTQGKASTIAYFGRQVLELNPNLLEDLTVFNRDGFWTLLLGVPRLFNRSPYEARDRLMAAFRVLADHLEKGEEDVQDVSPYIRLKHEMYAKGGMSKEGLASDKFNITFGYVSLLRQPKPKARPRPRTADILTLPFLRRLNSNSIPNAFCTLLHILSLPSLIPEIRAELSTAGYTTLPPSDYVTIIPSQVPLLQSIYWESLRMHINSTGIREVLSPTTLTTPDRTWKLQPGAVVTLVGPLLHEDPALHPDPLVFHPKRFLPREEGGMGQSWKKGISAFGGGTSYCPGRIFAEKQIIGFVAEVVMRYDVRIVSEQYSIPVSSDFEKVAAHPAVMVELRRRERE
jgi:hypothetical protein